MSKIKVLAVSDAKTKTDKPYKRLSVEVDGKKLAKELSIWSDHTQFADVKVDHVFEDDITEKDGYQNLANKDKKKGNSGFRDKKMDEVMARKESSISNFQDNKEWSIMESSTIRMAVDLAVAGGNPTPELILKWRTWLIKNWDVDYKDKEPFK